MRKPSEIYKPKLMQDGNMWIALYGKNIANGVVGTGKSPAAAVEAFDNNWYKDIEYKEDNYQQRLRDEETALNIKITNLEKFIGTEKFYSLRSIDRRLLEDQLHYMRQYSGTLNARIMRFSVEV